jgi:hypothetical protein
MFHLNLQLHVMPTQPGPELANLSRRYATLTDTHARHGMRLPFGGFLSGRWGLHGWAVFQTDRARPWVGLEPSEHQNGIRWGMMGKDCIKD